MMKKKGFGLQYYALIIAFFIGLVAFFLAKPMQFDGYIGNYNFYLIEATDKAENDVFYIEQAAKYSLQQSIYELASNGGVAEIEASKADTLALTKHECGRFNGAYVWYEVKKRGNDYIESSCFDDASVSINLEYLFNENLNSYLKNYQYSLPLDNYLYEIKEGLEIVATAISSKTYTYKLEKR